MKKKEECTAFALTSKEEKARTSLLSNNGQTLVRRRCRRPTRRDRPQHVQLVKGKRAATLAAPGSDACHQTMCDFVILRLGPAMVELALFSIFLTLTGGSQFSGR